MITMLISGGKQAMLINEDMLRERVYLEHSQFSGRETKILNENRRLYSREDKYDLFLSHSYSDKELVYSLVELFNETGYSVYVDWKMDTQLNRSMVNADTADLLRTRMKDCRGLAYVSTTNITQSKWCPWELGYVDGCKNGRCAILPIMKSESFNGQEYLGLYPYIDYEKNIENEKYDFWVNDPNDNQKYVALGDWLAGTDPYHY